uniref:Uncharacterized protein n=1 Tax=Physcomitrium patens TaxID=3218 RepID=A0A7I4BTN8_PHYPA|nr:tetratricopeptide repeat protein 27 homolog isoform X2 [Physcomitrium patens]|eukprot:XP_024385943.1 tetratricopeptide repeat protein 27 homolog isoform X2 [Physcomitrella patens]
MGILHLANELRLLRCTFTVSNGSLEQQEVEAHSDENGVNWAACLQHLVENIEAGEYFQALASRGVEALLWPGSAGAFKQGGSETENRAWFNSQKIRIKEFVSNQVKSSEVTEDDEEIQDLILLGAGVASLLAFVQSNLTGPQVGGSAISANTDDAVDDVDDWARQQLMIDGCDLLGKLYVPEYLILSKYLLVDIKTKSAGFATRSWWALRNSITQQRCLAERSPSLQSLLRDLSSTVLSTFGTTEVVQGQEWGHLLLPGEARILAAAAQLESGFVEHEFGHDNKARVCFERAVQTCGLELSVVGALGFRTVHQIDAKAQMVLRADSSSTVGAELDTWRRMSALDTKAKDKGSEILLAPKLVEEEVHNDVVLNKESSEGGLKVLSTIEQAVILAKCVDVQRSNPDDELRTWQMAPYIEAVYVQKQSDPMVRALCELLRVRWERLRSRTKERAYAMMEELAEEIRRGTTKTNVRMCHVFSVAFPMMPSFLNLLGKKAAAADLINRRLRSHPNDPRLWCSLGDVTLSDDCYRKAWEVSNQHYARAQRSLGRTSYSRKEYAKSMEHWKLALKLNPLHPDGWFALGSAAVQANDVDTAINAFTRSVQLDPENGESWNNLAALNMVRRRSKEAFSAFKEALKYKRNSWQMWENFAQVSVDISNFSQALEALNKVLELSEGKRMDLVTLTKIVEEVERLKTVAASANSTDSNLHDHGDASVSDQGRVVDIEVSQSEIHPPKNDEAPEQIMFNREMVKLFEKTGKLLNQVVQSKISGGEIWGLKARWHRANGDLMMCTEAALKQVRALQGTSWQNNQEKFESYATASLQLCQAYIETFQENGGAKDLSAAIMHLRTTLKQGQQFSVTDQYKKMEACKQEAEKMRETFLAKQQAT